MTALYKEYRGVAISYHNVSMKMAQKYVIGKQLGFILMNEEMKDEHKPFACFFSKDYLLLANLKE